MDQEQGHVGKWAEARQDAGGGPGRPRLDAHQQGSGLTGSAALSLASLL